MRRAAHITDARLRSYSSAFSRRGFRDIIRYGDYAHLDWLYHSENKIPPDITYLEYLKIIYGNLVRYHRCEYVYKNEIINHLIREYRTRASVIFNEFRVGSSIADLALFNGESKAFEIKTEFDTDKRLSKQILDYCRLFDKCYLVIPEEDFNHYVSMIDFRVGIIVLSCQGGRIQLTQIRDAQKNTIVDVNLLLSCCRTSEYESFMIKRLGSLPSVPKYDLFSSCSIFMKAVPSEELKKFFLRIVKQRKSELNLLSSTPKFLRQMCLSLNLERDESASLVEKLNKIIC